MSMLTLTRRRAPLAADLTPFEPWFHSFFGENGRFPILPEPRAMPRADVAETDKDLLITLELPGMEENDVSVRLTGNLLTISGERKQKKEDKDKHFFFVETTYGAFERSFELPPEVRREAESVKATFHKGMLEIRIPKVEPRPVARIPIKTT